MTSQSIIRGLRPGTRIATARRAGPLHAAHDTPNSGGKHRVFARYVFLRSLQEAFTLDHSQRPEDLAGDRGRSCLLFGKYSKRAQPVFARMGHSGERVSLQTFVLFGPKKHVGRLGITLKTSGVVGGRKESDSRNAWSPSPRGVLPNGCHQHIWTREPETNC